MNPIKIISSYISLCKWKTKGNLFVDQYGDFWVRTWEAFWHSEQGYKFHYSALHQNKLGWYSVDHDLRLNVNHPLPEYMELFVNGI